MFLYQIFAVHCSPRFIFGKVQLVWPSRTIPFPIEFLLAVPFSKVALFPLGLWSSQGPVVYPDAFRRINGGISPLYYRQIYKLRTLVLNLYIFGNAVKYQEVKETEQSEGYLTSVLHGI
jgi:hypothetical protein